MRTGKDTAISAIMDIFGCYADIARYNFGNLVREEMPNDGSYNAVEYRRKLQAHGLYRRQQDERYWIRKLAALIAWDKPEIALISSIRMKNELGWLRARGGVYVLVDRIGYKPDPEAAKDATENDLNDIAPDYALAEHDGHLFELQQHAVELFKRIAEKYCTPDLQGRLEKAMNQ